MPKSKSAFFDKLLDSSDKIDMTSFEGSKYEWVTALEETGPEDDEYNIKWHLIAKDDGSSPLSPRFLWIHSKRVFEIMIRTADFTRIKVIGPRSFCVPYTASNIRSHQSKI